MGRLGASGSRKGENTQIRRKLREIHEICLFGPSWECSWRPLRPSWSGLGGLLARLGASGSRKGENSKTHRKPNENQCFLTLGALLGGPLAASGGAFGPLGSLAGTCSALFGPPGASWGGRLGFGVRVPLFGPLLGPSWGPLGPSWAPLAPSWGHLGPSWGPRESLLGCLGAVFGPLGPSWSVGKLKKRKLENLSKTSNENQ